jgi:hypothetical protein
VWNVAAGRSLPNSRANTWLRPKSSKWLSMKVLANSIAHPNKDTASSAIAM